MKCSRLLIATLIITGLSACGGGGGGSAGAPNNPAPPAVSPSPSVTGDMLAIAPSRAWNYLTSASDGQFTVTLYADPNMVNGIQPLIALATVGDLPNAIGGATIGGLGVTRQHDGYHAATFVSAESSGAIPGTPLLVSDTLTLGAVTTPYVGVTETVISIGIPNGASACSGTNLTGATVQYIVQNQTYQLSYVPGCGITDFVMPSGQEFRLKSVASYPQLGQLAISRRVDGAGYPQLIRSMIHALLKI